MRGKILLFIIVTVLASCKTKQEPQSDKATPATVEDSLPKDSVATNDSTENQVAETEKAQAQAFLSLFKPMNPKGYHAYSPEFTGDMKVKTTQFRGVAIDAEKYHGLLNEKAVPYLESILKGYGGFFAIGKFDINPRYTGLVVRQHSQYSDTQVALLLWDKQRNQLIKGLELADTFGDAGWFFDTESWITEYAPNGKLVIVSRTKNFDPNEDFTSGTVTDSTKVSRFNGGKFISTTTATSDTTKYKLKRWKQYKAD